MKRTIRFDYERSVRWGAEQATLHEALRSMGLVSGDSRLSAAYRKIYGSSDAALRAAAGALATDAYRASAVILVDSAVKVPQDLKTATQLQKSVSVTDLSAELAPLEGKRVLTPEEAQRICNALLDAGQLPVQFVPAGARMFSRRPGSVDASTGEMTKINENRGATFGLELFSPYWNGTFPTYENGDGQTVSSGDLLAFALGSKPAMLTPADVEVMRAASTFASSLGVSLADVAALKPSGDGTDAVLFSLRADWSTNDLTNDSKGAADDEGSDWYRFNAERPGGQNFDDAVAALKLDRFGDAEDQRARMHAAVDVSRRTTATLSRTVDKDVRKPDADIQKKDSYAVIRIASGFNQQWSDVYANPGKFKTLFQTNRFLLQSHQETRAERMNLLETFGPTYLYLFGKRPKMWNYSGVLMDTVGLDWLNEWRSAWELVVGGTNTAKAKARAFLIYRDVVREGIMVASAESASINELGYATFSFSMFVMKEHFLSGDPMPGQTSPEIRSTPQSGATTSVKENYDYSFNDNTEDARGRFLASLEAGQRAVAGQVSNIEDQLSAGRTSEIEGGILKQAFSGGRLVSYAGSVKLPLATAEAQQAIEQSERLAREADMQTQSPVLAR